LCVGKMRVDEPLFFRLGFVHAGRCRLDRRSRLDRRRRLDR
jgi:hypothetical protein